MKYLVGGDVQLNFAFVSGPDGEPLRYSILQDEYAEARHVARCIQERLLNGIPPDEIAVFYRVGALSRALEAALVERGVTYRIVGSVPFYQRREIKDVICYLRLARNPHDDLALKRVINVPSRGVGKGSVAKLKARARELDGSLIDAVHDFVGRRVLKGRSRRGLAELAELIDGLAQEVGIDPSIEGLIKTDKMIVLYY